MNVYSSLCNTEYPSYHNPVTITYYYNRLQELDFVSYKTYVYCY